MTTSPRPNPHADDDAMVRRLLDNVLTPEEFAQLQERLQSDEAFRQRYVELVDLEAGLYEECSLPTPLTSYPAPRRPVRRSNRGPVAALLALGALALLVIVSQWLGPQPPDAPPPIAGEDVPAPAESEPLFEFQPARIDETPPAAVLTAIDDAGAIDLQVGHRFRPGTLTFGRGRLQLDFLSGARVAIVGPARLQIISKDAATLLSGQAAARVPPAARGFVLNTPEAAVVDLGTEFGVSVAASGATEVDVLQGEVEVSELGEDGATLVSLQFDESEAVRVDDTGMNRFAARDGLSYPTVAAAFTTVLDAGPDYRDAILQSAPVIYWRFEQDHQGQIINEMDDRWAAQIVRDPNDSDSIQFVDGHVVLQPSRQPRYLAATDPLPAINAGPYTIELWLRPEQLTHMSCLSVVPTGDPGSNHLNVIEIAAAQTHLIHEPGSVRFLHRFPPTKGRLDDVNLFTRATCTPGKWQHVVAVKEKDALSLYSDGRLARKIQLDLSDEPAAYDLYLGQLRTRNTERQFVGAIDEFALYDRALPPEEIEHHFQMIPRAPASQ